MGFIKFEIVTRPNLQHKVSDKLRFDDPATEKTETHFFIIFTVTIPEKEFTEYVSALALSPAVCTYFYGIEPESTT